jgi:hypothetical protein
MTTYETLRSDWVIRGALYSGRWLRVILDEGKKFLKVSTAPAEEFVKLTEEKHIIFAIVRRRSSRLLLKSNPCIVGVLLEHQSIILWTTIVPCLVSSEFTLSMKSRVSTFGSHHLSRRIKLEACSYSRTLFEPHV